MKMRMKIQISGINCIFLEICIKLYTKKYFFDIIIAEKRKRGDIIMKRLVIIGAVYTHANTLLNKIVRDDKSFCISRNLRNLKENCEF